MLRSSKVEMVLLVVAMHLVSCNISDPLADTNDSSDQNSWQFDDDTEGNDSDAENEEGPLVLQQGGLKTTSHTLSLESQGLQIVDEEIQEVHQLCNGTLCVTGRIGP
jgi:hypothetical protein